MDLELKQVIQTLVEAGYPTYVVGGAVRDFLMGKIPKDWDVATAAPPEIVMSLFPHTIPTGLQHGTVTVMTNREAIEVTTFRGEGGYDGRRPSKVQFLSRIEEDLERRDFTINAMALTLEGEIIDPFGGKRDLEQGRICAVGSARERFQEDQLRILRGIRFISKFGFVLEPETFRAAQEALHHRGFDAISQERILSELLRTLQEAKDGESRGRAILLLHEMGGMEALHIPWKNWNTDLAWYRDWFHGKPIEVMLAMLFRPLWGELGGGTTVAKNLYDQFRIPLEIGRQIILICRTRPEIRRDLDPAHAGRILISQFPEIENWLWIEEAFGHPHKEIRAQVEAALAGPPFPRSIKHLPISGHDLLQLGRKGQEVGEGLKHLLDQMLERPELTRTDLLGLIKDQIGSA